MKENLIEVLTKLTFSPKLSNMVVAICAAMTKEEDTTYKIKLAEF
jgi:hypothetical protein